MGILGCLAFRPRCKKGSPNELLDIYKADRHGDVNAGQLSSADLDAICSSASARCQASVPQDTAAHSLLQAIISSSPDAISIYDLSSGKILISNAPSQSLPVPRDTDTLESVFAQDPNSLKQALYNIKHGICWRGKYVCLRLWYRLCRSGSAPANHSHILALLKKLQNHIGIISL